MAERKKGYSKKDLTSILERKVLAPFPAWNAWEHTLEKEMGEDVYQKQLSSEQKDALHKRYLIAVKGKLGINADSDLVEYRRLHNILVEKHMTENDNPKFEYANKFLQERVSLFRQF